MLRPLLISVLVVTASSCLFGAGSACDGGVCAGADGGLVVNAKSQAITRAVTSYFEGGSRTEATDFGAPGATVPQLFVRSGSTFTAVTTGAATARGTYLFTDVPDGERYVAWGKNWVVNPANPLVLDSAQQGRADVAFADARPVELIVNATGLSPWVEGSDFQLIAPGAGTVEINYGAGLVGVPDAGATPAVLRFDHRKAHAWDYGDADPAPLPDTSKGDVIWLAQMEYQPLTTASASLDAWRLVKGAPLSPLTLAAGSTSGAAGNFSGSGGGTFNLDWRRGDFWALAPQVNPSVRSNLSWDALNLDAWPYTTAEGESGGAPDLVLVDNFSSGDRDPVAATIPYRNPYPASWNLVGSVNQCFYLPAQDAGVLGGFSANGCIGHDGLYPAFGGGPLTPKLSPPTNLQFDGQNGYASQTLASRTPTITWAAPTVGSANHYQVTIRKVARAADGSALRPWVADFTTHDLKLVVPPGVLASGEHYYVWVAARQTALDATATPLRRALPEAHAQALSGLMLAP